MKTLTFFNEKGGVGKSTFTALMASWLQYVHGKNVMVLDFDYKLSDFRKKELRIARIKNPDFDEKSLWKCITVNHKEIAKKYGQPGKDNTGYAFWFDSMADEGLFDGVDVLLIDFPGSFKSFVEIYFYKKIGLIIVPTDRTSMTLETTLTLLNIIKKYKFSKVACFINQIQHFVSRSIYEDVKKVIMDFGVDILPDMVSFSERIKKINNEDTLTSTLSFPNWNAPEHKSTATDLGITNLFIDILKLLNETPDIAGTKKTDLSFVNSLIKEPQEKRQLKNSSFPEFEI